MNIFKAGVQYNDIRGTVAGDRSDNKSMLEYLKKNGIAEDGETLVGMRFGFSGNDSKNVDVTNVIVYLLETEEFIERPKEVRAVHINLPIAEFFSFFKRFDLIMSTSSMILDQDTIVDGPHYD